MALLLGAVELATFVLDLAVGRSPLAALATAASLAALAFVCGAVLLAPPLFPALLLCSLLAPLLSLPHVSRRRLRLLGAATLAAALFVGAVGIASGRSVELLGAPGRALLAASLAAFALLALLLVWQTATGLQAAVREAAAVGETFTVLRAADREALEWATFLAEAARLLGESLDLDETLRRIGRLAVPRIADWCTVASREGGAMRRTAVYHADPAKADLARLYAESFPPTEHRPEAARVDLAAEPRLIPEVTHADLARLAQSPAHLDALERLGVASAMVVPLVARGRTIGVLSFMISGGERRYGPKELVRAQELAARAALGVDNARLFRELAEARNRLQEAVAARDEFLTIASHELNTPLTALKIQVELARRQKGTPGQIEERLLSARRQVDRLQSLVARLLDVSQLLAGGPLRLEPRELDLRELVAEVVQRFREPPFGGSELVLDAPEPVFGDWDGFRIDELVTNLVGNAVKYGEGRPVRVSLGRLGDRAQLVVADSGIGIPPEDRERLFGRFERAVSVRSFPGLGLGLWIVRRIVEASGGTVRVESAVGSGSTFFVELPGARERRRGG